jgi:hypothetical protein
VRKILIAVMLILSQAAFADYSMRRCVLLPVSDGVGGAIGLKLFADVEKYLLENTWCEYQSNSDMLGVFSRYRENLENHLRTPQVVKVVADRLKVGSIVRINLRKEIGTLEVQVDVVAENGEDIYFTEKTVLTKDDLELAFQTIRNWLEIFGRTIPYDGKVMGVVGDQVTLDVGRMYTVKVGQPITLKRLRQTKKHPLLKKIVEWDAMTLATGKIFNISENQALGVVKSYKTESKIQVGDWVRIEKMEEDSTLNVLQDYNSRKDSFGKLGIASLALSLGSSSFSSTNSSSRRMDGLMVGFDANIEAWVTRNWFGVIGLDRSLGNLSKASGSFDSSKSSYQRGTFELGGGYKYLPLGFFYGPQVDFKLSYLNNLYKADYNQTDGIGSFNVTGFAMGISANFPVGRAYRGYLGAQFMPFPGFEDGDGAFSGAKSTTWTQLALGVKYQYNQAITLDGTFEMTSTKSSFNGTVRSVSANDSQVKVGASHNF